MFRWMSGFSVFCSCETCSMSSSRRMTLYLRFLVALSLGAVFPANSESLLQKTVWFLSSLALKLCFVFIFLFFFNLNFQKKKSIYFCLWCQKTTLWRIFLVSTVTFYSFYPKKKKKKKSCKAGNPTHPLFLVATLCQWLCYLKNRITWPDDAMAFTWLPALVGIHYPASFTWQNWWYPPRGIKWFIRENILTCPYHKGLHEGRCFINDGYLMQNTSLWC